MKRSRNSTALDPNMAIPIFNTDRHGARNSSIVAMLNVWTTHQGCTGAYTQP